MDIQANLRDVWRKIEAAGAKSGRKIDKVKLVAVSKNVPVDSIYQAYNAGQRCFGENRVQEWLQKHDLLPGDCEWHIIGRLQSNKVKYLNEKVALIHSLDRFSLLEKLNSEGEKRGVCWPALLQVNVAKDAAKAGLEMEEVNDFLLEAKKYPNVKISGLMTIGDLDARPEQTRGYFRKLREIRDGIIAKGLYKEQDFYHLSMGMSGDFEMAVEEGATIIRVGSKIFGQRI